MSRSARWIGSLLFLAAVACSDAAGPSSPPVVPAPTIEGTYVATRLTTTTFGGTIDRLAQGLSMTMRVMPDGTTEGTVIAEDDTVPVVGTWDTAGSFLHFHQENATFMRQLPFHILPNQLVGDSALGATTWGVTLQKQ